MPNVLTPNAKQQFFTSNGLPAVSYRLFTYAAGTSTKIATKGSPSGADNANPIVLDYRGECNVWIAPNVSYKYVLAPPGSDDPPTAPVWTVDSVVSSQLITLYGGLDTGSANNYILNYTSNFSAYVDGIIVYWIPSHTNTGGSVVGINGLGAVSIFKPSGSVLNAGDIVANQIVGMIYIGGSFLLLSSTTKSSFFTGSLSGMTAAVTGQIDYTISGSLCTLSASLTISGTSNSAAMVLSGLPAEVQSATSRNVTCTKLIDNGVTLNASANVASTVTFNPWAVSGTRIVDGTFTAAGTKGISAGWSVTYFRSQ